MFSVTAHNCATGYSSYGHEIAHSFGCNHDLGTKEAWGTSNCDYGYRDPNVALGLSGDTVARQAMGQCQKGWVYKGATLLRSKRPISGNGSWKQLPE